MYSYIEYLKLEIQCKMIFFQFSLLLNNVISIGEWFLHFLLRVKQCACIQKKTYHLPPTQFKSWLTESPMETLTQFNVCCVVIQTLFQYVTSLMRQGYQEESNKQRQLALSPKERPDKRNTALWEASSLRHNSRLFPPVQHWNVFMYIVYLLSPFLHRSCLPLSLFAILSEEKKMKRNMRWLLTKHFISELNFCCRQEHDEMIKVADKIYWL